MRTPLEMRDDDKAKKNKADITVKEYIEREPIFRKALAFIRVLQAMTTVSKDVTHLLVKP